MSLTSSCFFVKCSCTCCSELGRHSAKFPVAGFLTMSWKKFIFQRTVTHVDTSDESQTRWKWGVLCSLLMTLKVVLKETLFRKMNKQTNKQTWVKLSCMWSRSPKLSKVLQLSENIYIGIYQWVLSNKHSVEFRVSEHIALIYKVLVGCWLSCVKTRIHTGKH